MSNDQEHNVKEKTLPDSTGQQTTVYHDGSRYYYLDTDIRGTNKIYIKEPGSYLFGNPVKIIHQPPMSDMAGRR